MMLRVLESDRRQEIDVAGLERSLRSAVDGEVRFDQASRAVYSTDASNYRQIPIGVVVPRTTDAIVSAVAACREHSAPIVGRGGGTSLAGQCCNVAVVIDTSKHLHHVLDIDPQARTATVQPGTNLDDLRHRTEREHNLTFGPDPATHSHCTFGGMIGNNSCGIHSVMAGRTADNVHELEILTYDGTRMRVGMTADDEYERIVRAGGRRAEIYQSLRRLRDRNAGLIRERYPDIPRRVSGYNLPELLPERGFHVARALVGTESTCAFVLEAKVRLVDSPRRKSLLVLGYPSVYEAADHVPEVLESRPIGLEGIDEMLVNFMKKKHLHPEDINLLPEGKGWLLVEFGGETTQEADEKARKLMGRLESGRNAPEMKLFDDPEEEQRVWEIRESGLGATAYVPGMRDAWPGWEDSAVHPHRMGEYLRKFRKLLDKYDYECSMYGHFGDGCLHCRISFDLTSKSGVRRYRDFVGEAADLVHGLGGSFSGEHGDGQARGELLEKMYGPELVRAFREFKRIWDPDWKLNPGKVIDPYPIDANLKLGGDYAPWNPRTHYQYPEDDGSFAHAALRCVGVGKCRRPHDAFMCPSFRATREEKHTTRGRARALFEMTRGDFIRDGWRSDAVHEVLDLCLGCKACKSECPVDVDMAAYKSEFLSHYFAGRLRPRAHYAMGLIDRWAAMAAWAPGAANFFSQTTPFAPAAKWFAGVDQQRRLPQFAKQTFRKWFERRGGSRISGTRVVLLADVFNDHFFPETLQAAVEVLEHFGYRPELPHWRLPAIRPRLHYGMVKSGRSKLRETIERLASCAREEVAIIGVEPSTVSVYREDLHSLFPHDLDADRVKANTWLLSEFLDTRDVELPQVGGKAIFHAHCHQKAVLQADAARNLLKRMAVERQEPEPGCCGMAGSFGYEAGEHHEVSQIIANQHLLPAVRDAGPDVPIVVEGFSCREQIAQGSGREPLHLAQFVANALRAARSTNDEEHRSKERT